MRSVLFDFHQVIGQPAISPSRSWSSNSSIYPGEYVGFYVTFNTTKDGIFTAKMPLKASTNPSFESNLPILHKLMMFEGQKIFYTGKANEQTEYDVLIAPGTEFKKVFDEDEDNSVWKCINQPFYDEEVEDDGE